MDNSNQKTTRSSALLRPYQKPFAAPTGSQTLAVCPPAALPLPLCECSSFGTSFPLDTGKPKNRGRLYSLVNFHRLILFAGRDKDEPLRPRDVATKPAFTSLDSSVRTCDA